MDSDGPVMVTDRLTKKYGEFVALDSLSISLGRGKILGFIGPNGAGKTTTIKILVGQARPTSGSATIAGVDCVRDAKHIKRLVGYMPASSAPTTTCGSTSISIFSAPRSRCRGGSGSTALRP